jgi:N-acetyl-alpha-D-muramate 1-phosphate uridylyltransferase
MRAMILAAGRGQRMGALTETRPKPLLEIAGKPLIVYHLERLAAVGITEIVINTAYLSGQITAALGDGSNWGVRITYSREHGSGLEVAGGIINALPLLGDDAFITVNADIYTDYDFAQLRLPRDALAHCVLVANPDHNREGDFCLENGLLQIDGMPRYTFAGIGCYAPAFFANHDVSRKPLKPLLIDAAKQSLVTAELFNGVWLDVGTPERLAQVQSFATKKS